MNYTCLKYPFIFILGILITAAGAAILVYTISNHKVSNANQVKNVYEITEEFDNFNIKVETVDVELKYSEYDKCVVEVLETDKLSHNVEVKDNALTITNKDNRKWMDRYFFFNYVEMKITISLPKDKTSYNELKANITTGDVKVDNSIEFNKVVYDSTTGDIELKNANCKSFSTHITSGHVTLTNVNIENALEIETTTGDIRLTNVIANSFNIVTTTGDVTFDKCDAHSIKVEATTGDVKGTLLTAKTFNAKTTTGDVEVPKTSSSDTCVIDTTTGDIEIEIVNA